MTDFRFSLVTLDAVTTVVVVVVVVAVTIELREFVVLSFSAANTATATS